MQEIADCSSGVMLHAGHSRLFIWSHFAGKAKQFAHLESVCFFWSHVACKAYKIVQSGVRLCPSAVKAILIESIFVVADLKHPISVQGTYVAEW